MRNVILYQVITFILLLSIAIFSNAMEHTVDVHANNVDLSAHTYFVDSNANSPQVLLAENPHFKPAHEKIPNPTADKVWYKLTFDSPNEHPKNWFVELPFPNVPVLKAYLKNEAEHWQLIYDDSKPFSNRDFQHALMVLPIEERANASVSILIEYIGIANIPLSFKLYNQKGIEQAQLQHVLFNALLLAFALLVGILSLLQCVIARKKVSGALSLLSFFIAAYISESSGFNFQYLWPNVPEINAFMPMLLAVFIFIAYLYFVILLFDLVATAPKLYKLYSGLIVFILALLFANLFIDTLVFLLFFIILCGFLPVSTGFWAYRKRLWAANFFIVGALCNFILNIVVTGLCVAGFFSISAITLPTISKLGFVLEILAFSVALIYQAGLIQKKLESAEQAKIEEAKKLIIVEKEKNKLQVKQEKQILLQKVAQERADMMATLVRQKNEFFSDITHELGTPLTVLKLQVGALQDNLEDDVKETYKSMDNKLSEMESLIRDVYQLSQTEAGDYELNIEDVAMFDCVTAASVDYQRLVQENNLKWTFSNNISSDNLASIDKKRLNQVFINLISNSVKYTTVPGEVSFSCTQDKDHVIIVIEDSAPSIDESEFELIFDRLYRCESSRSRETGGSGLGLAICKSLINIQGGTLGASLSKLGGVKMKITLPLKKIIK